MLHKKGRLQGLLFFVQQRCLLPLLSIAYLIDYQAHPFARVHHEVHPWSTILLIVKHLVSEFIPKNIRNFK